jgi:HEAT repeat protein
MGLAKFYIFKPNIKKMESRKDVKRLINVLKYHRNEKVMEEASLALGRLGEPAVKPLIREYLLTFDKKREEKIGYTRTRAINENIIKSFKSMNNPTKYKLITGLSDKDVEIRVGAARVIKEIEYSQSIEALIKSLGDESEEVRVYAAQALTEIQDERAIKPLLNALNDQSPSVRKASAFALGEYKRKELVDPLLELLKDKDSDPRSGAAWSLGTIGDERAVEPLINALSDDDCSVRTAAARSLGEIGDKRALKPLIRALDDEDTFVRKRAIDSLGKLGDNSVVDLLVKLLQDEDGFVQAASAGALGRLDYSQARIKVLEAINFRLNLSLAKQEIKKLIPFSIIGGFIIALMIMFIRMNFIKDTLSLFSLSPSTPFWIGFMITILFLGLIMSLLFFSFGLFTESWTINSIAILLNGVSFYSSDLFEILEKKLKKRYEIELTDIEGLVFQVTTAKGKTYKIGIWECDLYSKNDYILSVFKYKKLDPEDQDFIIRSIKESALESLIESDDD